MKKLAVLAFLLAVPAAHAQQGYLGVGVGLVTADLRPVPGFFNTIDDSDTTFKVFAGVQFTPRFAIEASYLATAEVSRRTSDGVDVVDERIEANALSLAGVGILPFPAGRAFLKLGLTYSSVDDAVSFNGAPLGSVSSNDIDPMFGFGLELDLARHLSMRAEFERHTDAGGGDLGEADVDVFGASLVYRF